MAAVLQEDLVARLQDYQDRLAEAERLGPGAYEAAFRNPPRGIAVHEFDGSAIILKVNSEELRLLGYEEHQLVGKRIWEFVVMEDISRESVRKKLSGEKDIKPFVRTFKRADGSGVAMLLVDRRLYDARGEMRGIRTAMMQVAEEG
jgi:PAS domain S-box-containing protein